MLWPKRGSCLGGTSVTALETLDFRREAVIAALGEECDLHAIVTPTTDLSREGLFAPATQVDAGYRGTLNWTLNNTSGDVREFKAAEPLFKLLIFKLDVDEKPVKVYTGKYQDQKGVVSSGRSRPGAGIRPDQWIDTAATVEDNDDLDSIKKLGGPFKGIVNHLEKFEQTCNTNDKEFEKVNDKIDKLRMVVKGLQQTVENLSGTVELFNNRLGVRDTDQNRAIKDYFHGEGRGEFYNSIKDYFHGEGKTLLDNILSPFIEKVSSLDEKLSASENRVILKIFGGFGVFCGVVLGAINLKSIYDFLKTNPTLYVVGFIAFGAVMLHASRRSRPQ